MDNGLIIFALLIGLVMFFAFFAKALISWLFDIEKRTKLMQEQNALLTELLKRFTDQ